MTGAAPSLLARSPLRHRLFLAVWFGALSLGFGNQMQLVGASWAMTEMTHSPRMVSFVAFALNAPLLLFSITFGALSDLYDRRKVMVAASLIMLVAALGMAVLGYVGMLRPTVLLTLCFVFGTGFALNMPAWQASVRELVPADEIPAAISMNAVGNNVTRTVGPGLGGIVVALGGVQSAFALNALACLPILGSLQGWGRKSLSEEASRERLSSAIAGGLRFTFYSGALSRVVLRALFASVGYIAMLSLLPLGVAHWLDGGSAIYGLLLSCAGVGSFLGVAASRPLAKSIGPESTLRLTHVAMAIALVGVPLSSNVLLSGALMLIFGAGSALMMLTFNVHIQLASPSWVVGRALSVFQMGAFGGLALGALLWGTVADAIGIETTFHLVAGGLVLAAFAFGWLAPLEHPDPAMLEAVGIPLEFPELGPEIHHLPIDITCEYEIDRTDEGEFLALMREWRRLRLSHGVRDWSLTPDPARLGVWVERFHRPTASDLLRQLHRMTRREKEIVDRFEALHRGEQAPRRAFTVRKAGRAGS